MLKLLHGALVVSVLLSVAIAARETHRLRGSVDLLTQAVRTAPIPQRDDLSAQSGVTTTPAQALDPTLLREIVSQAVAEQLSVVSQPVEPEAAPVQQREAQQDQVTQSIEYHVSVGSISNGEMQRLQGQILRLDPQARQRALRKLVGAMNDGTIKGRL